MKKKWIFAIPIIAVLFVTIGGQAVMQLWNWLMPAIFGWKEITFWQALGLLALCRILFGGGGGWGEAIAATIGDRMAREASGNESPSAGAITASSVRRLNLKTPDAAKGKIEA